MGFSIQNNKAELSFYSELSGVNSTTATFYLNPDPVRAEVVYAQFSVILLKTCESAIYLQYLRISSMF